MSLDISFGQILQACIVAALIAVSKALWNTGIALERFKSWAESHEKLDDLRFAALNKQVEWLQKDIERASEDLRHHGT